MTPDTPDTTGPLRVPGDRHDTGPIRLPALDEGEGEERLIKHTAVMSVGTALSRLTGFGRLAALAFALGVVESRLADAYNIANTTPNMIYDLVLGGILSSVFVPVFVEWLRTRGRDEAWDVARAVLTITVVVGGAITLAGIVFARPIVGLYTARFGSGPEAEHARALATFFLRWFLPQILLYGLGAGVMTGLLNAHRRFAAPMFAPILNNLVVIATFLTFAAMHDEAVPTPESITNAERLVLAIGTTAGVAAMTVALWPSLRRIGFRWRWSLAFRHPAVRKIGTLAAWGLVYVVVNQIGLFFVVLLAGQGQGDYTAYASAFIFFQLPYGIFAVSIMTALLPSLSQSWVQGDRAEFRADLARGIRATAFIVLPAALGYIALSQPIVRLALQHGVSTAASTDRVADVLVFFALGLFSFSAFQVLLRAFYAMQDTRTPAIVNVFAVALNTGANFALYAAFGVRGLALGHAAAYTFAATTSALILRRRLGGLEWRPLANGVARIAAGALATGAVAWLAAWAVGRALGTETLLEQLLQVGVAVAAGLTIFTGAAILLRMEDFGLVKRFLLDRLRRTPR